jgi:hypothetical protein
MAKRPRDDDDDEPRVKKRRASADDEVEDDDAPREKRKGSKKKDGNFARVVPYKNTPALLGYYCGVFSWIPVLSVLLGPIAIMLGSIGFFKALANPKAKGMIHALAGIGLGIVATPLWVVAYYLFFESMTRPEG